MDELSESARQGVQDASRRGAAVSGAPATSGGHQRNRASPGGAAAAAELALHSPGREMPLQRLRYPGNKFGEAFLGSCMPASSN